MDLERKEFVLGFAFSESKQVVALIRKNGKKFPWMKDLYNGIGGFVEYRERPADAMVREFEEETGVNIHKDDWLFKGRFFGAGFIVFVFVTFSDDIYKVVTQEEEEVVLLGISALNSVPTIPNLKWLIPMCLNKNVTIFAVQER